MLGSGLRRGWPLLLILALAAGLRFYAIGAQSLWYDEGNSARIAERSVQLIIEGAAGDIHPPLYYIALRFWRALFGSSEAALRALSAAANLGSVVLTYALGRDLFDRRTGWLAAALLAIAPFAVYYSQEARMYALLALCASLSTWALARWHALPNRRFGSLFVLATAAGLWVQYAYPFVMLAQGLWTLARCAEQRDRRMRWLAGYALLNTIAIGLYAPWLPIALRQIRGWSVAAQSYSLPVAALDAFRWLVVGRASEPRTALPAMLLVGVLAISGIALGRAPRSNRAGLVALCALPLVLLFAFGLYRDAYLKILLVCVAPLLTLVAAGIDAISRLVQRIYGRPVVTSGLAARMRSAQPLLATATAGALLAAVAITVLPALHNQVTNPAYARDDYRGIYQRIQQANPDSAVIFNAPNQWEVYTYYQHSERGLHPLAYRPGSAGEAAQQLERIVFGQRDVFVLYYAEREADPAGWYEAWLATNAFKVNEAWVGNIRLARYVGSATLQPVARDVVFGDALIAERVDADLTRGDGVVPIAITWRARQTPGTRYKIFVHVGTADAPPIAQSDSEPATPTIDWQPAQPQRDLRGVWVKPGAPPGQWGVFIGIYDAATGQRIGERVKIGEINISAR
jgi:mannosyltransferase